VVDGSGLVLGRASATHIADCAVGCASFSTTNSSYWGFIACYIEEKSVVERCFADGTFRQMHGTGLYFGGIAGQCYNSSVRHCAVGSHTVRPYGGWIDRIQRIVCSVENSSTVQNNAAIDTTPGTDDKNGSDGKTVAAGVFKQRFFEDTLCWDFETVWQWDDAKQRPSLRAVGPNAVAPSARSAAPMPEAMEDLLTRQVLGNMWL
jgi:MoxR-like ATPase